MFNAYESIHILKESVKQPTVLGETRGGTVGGAPSSKLLVLPETYKYQNLKTKMFIYDYDVKPPSEPDSIVYSLSEPEFVTPDRTPEKTPERSDSEARESFQSPSSIATPELLAQPDFGYITRLATQAPRTIYKQRHPREMSNPDFATEFLNLQDTVASMEERFRNIADRFGQPNQAATTQDAGGASPSTAAIPGTLYAEMLPPAESWASLRTTATPQLAATEVQALRLALALKAKLMELQPGRDAHEARFLAVMMEHYPALLRFRYLQDKSSFTESTCSTSR
uniref:Uncharacterized protein n=1 Tax=Timema genevievae TaxID=629358 RepID=A0A7R9K2E4_TIMGE|nr:unnamed protein product [Timema genevievae]